MNDAIIAPARHRLDVDAYHRMGAAGILTEDDRVELIDGELIDMAPVGQDHAGIVNGLTKALVMACGDQAIVSTQNPVRLDRYNEPQPDFAVLRYRPDFYTKGDPPGPADTLLLLEVGDSSLTFDRTVKLPLYARAGIPEVWIVDVQHHLLHAHRTPGSEGYTEITIHYPGERLALSEAPDIVVPLTLVFD